MPHETAAVSAQVLCTPYNHAPCHIMQSHIRKVYACLAVTCHLHFWQNDRDLLRATAVTRGRNGYRNKSQHRKSTLEKKFSRRSCRDSNPRPFSPESGALTTELSPHLCQFCFVLFFLSLPFFSFCYAFERMNSFKMTQAERTDGWVGGGGGIFFMYHVLNDCKCEHSNDAAFAVWFCCFNTRTVPTEYS